MGIKVTGNVLFYSYGIMKGYRSFRYGIKLSLWEGPPPSSALCCDYEQRNIRMYSV